MLIVSRQKQGSGYTAAERPFKKSYFKYIIKLNIFMSEDYKMSKQDKIALGITLAAIFGGVFILGFIGLVINIFF